VGLQIRQSAEVWVWVDRRGPDECWPWRGRCSPAGYGKLGEDYAHRLVAEIARGPIGKAVVRHSCDNPPCCNPRHLIAGTQADNMRDAALKGRIGGGRRPTPIDLPAVRARIAAGESVNAVARSLGVTWNVLGHQLDPAKAERHRIRNRRHASRMDTRQ
jgi:hypothetical protein